MDSRVCMGPDSWRGGRAGEPKKRNNVIIPLAELCRRLPAGTSRRPRPEIEPASTSPPIQDRYASANPPKRTMLYTVKIMRGKTTLKQFAVIADGDATLQTFAADALGEQADDTAEMMKFGVSRASSSSSPPTRCSSSFAAAASASCERAAGAWSACRALGK